MFQFFLCNLTDTCSFVAERIYEYHTNILLVALVVMVIVMGGLYFTYLFLVKNTTYVHYNLVVSFKCLTLITLYERLISSIFKKFEIKRGKEVFETRLQFGINYYINRNLRLALKLLGLW